MKQWLNRPNLCVVEFTFQGTCKVVPFIFFTTSLLVVSCLTFLTFQQKPSHRDEEFYFYVNKIIVYFTYFLCPIKLEIKHETGDWVTCSSHSTPSTVSSCKWYEINVYLLDGQLIPVTNYGAVSHYFVVALPIQAKVINNTRWKGEVPN